jgi:hypothetical protein
VLAIGYAFGYALENLILESVNERMSSHILIPLSKKDADNLAMSQWKGEAIGQKAVSHFVVH